MHRWLEFVRTVCTVVGALTIWALVAGTVASVVIRRIKRAGSPPVLVGAAAAGSDHATPRLDIRSRAAGRPALVPLGAAGPAGYAGSSQPLGRVERRAQTWVDVPSWVARDRQWAVAVVLLGSPDIATRTHRYVDFSRRRIAWSGLLAEARSWPRRERLLVYLAQDLAHDLAQNARQATKASSSAAPSTDAAVVTDAADVTDAAGPAAGWQRTRAEVAVAELVTDLDDVALARVTTAVDVRRGAVGFDEAVERVGGLG